MKKNIVIVLLCILIVLLGLGLYGRFFGTSNKSETVSQPAETTVEPTATPTPTPVPTPTPDFYSTDSLLVLANKTHALPDGYEPSDLVIPAVSSTTGAWQLRQEAATALENMFNAAKENGVYLVLGSAYRSADYQAQLFNGYVASKGEEYADRVSSRPGRSDHQTGLAVDISDQSGATFLSQSFSQTAEGKWLKENAHLYGWIMRYPEGKEEITGYIWEPWHFRYIGVEEATKLYESGENMSFEEYYNILD